MTLEHRDVGNARSGNGPGECTCEPSRRDVLGTEGEGKVSHLGSIISRQGHVALARQSLSSCRIRTLRGMRSPVIAELRVTVVECLSQSLIGRSLYEGAQALLV